MTNHQIGLMEIYFFGIENNYWVKYNKINFYIEKLF